MPFGTQHSSVAEDHLSIPIPEWGAQSRYSNEVDLLELPQLPCWDVCGSPAKSPLQVRGSLGIEPVEIPSLRIAALSSMHQASQFLSIA